MSRTRTRTQYRVLSRRADGSVKQKLFGSLGAAQNRVSLLTSPEPWRFYGSDADRQRDGTELECCAGTVYDACGCGGLTVAEKAAQEREGLPALEWARIEKRTVTTTAWEPTA